MRSTAAAEKPSFRPVGSSRPFHLRLALVCAEVPVNHRAANLRRGRTHPRSVGALLRDAGCGRGVSRGRSADAVGRDHHAPQANCP